MGEFGEDVGGGRRDDERVGGLSSIDVLNGRGSVAGVGAFGSPEAGDDFVAGESGEGERRDELLRGRGHHHMHVEGVLLQIANQFRGLVGSDAAGDANRDLHEYRVQGTGCRVQALWCGRWLNRACAHCLPESAYKANFGISAPSTSGRTVGASSAFT